MAASEQTIKQILDVCERHFQSQEQVRAFVVDLYRHVTGNASVMRTLERLEEATR